MKTKYCSKVIKCLLILSLVLPMSLKAQDPEENAAARQPRIYSQEELDRLLAPIALYPDTLLSQVLMASYLSLWKWSRQIAGSNRTKVLPEIRWTRLWESPGT